MGETEGYREGYGTALRVVDVLRRRPQLLWLLVPYVLYLGALPLVNRVRPLVLGLPFLFFWLLGATVLTPVAVWLARRGDRR
ncbi:hypothetical protein EES39_05745 [Streptomyces sp. ADI92-24]|nr:uncharacterized protein DUF3311 [Streptomyces sp. CEV 2-1]RPK50324.1 hypothetical protein EES39_05745 [Streptomyces sp. ADI92-24]